MVNLLEETREILEKHDLSLDDVVWVGTRNVEIPFEIFLKLADREYNNNHRIAQVAADLVICGDTWWLERWECNGSEGWNFKTSPQRPDNTIVPQRTMDEYSVPEALNAQYDSEWNKKSMENRNRNGGYLDYENKNAW